MKDVYDFIFADSSVLPNAIATGANIALHKRSLKLNERRQTDDEADSALKRSEIERVATEKRNELSQWMRFKQGFDEAFTGHKSKMLAERESVFEDPGNATMTPDELAKIESQAQSAAFKANIMNLPPREIPRAVEGARRMDQSEEMMDMRERLGMERQAVAREKIQSDRALSEERAAAREKELSLRMANEAEKNRIRESAEADKKSFRDAQTKLMDQRRIAAEDQNDASGVPTLSRRLSDLESFERDNVTHVSPSNDTIPKWSKSGKWGAVFGGAIPIGDAKKKVLQEIAGRTPYRGLSQDEANSTLPAGTWYVDETGNTLRRSKK